jgi:hypothetical protein
VDRLGVAVDVTPLALFRIAFGAILIWEVARWFALGWIDALWQSPALHFTYLGFGWVRPWPGRGLVLHCLALAVLAVGVLLGACYRTCAALFTLGFTYVFLLDQTQYLNHVYLMCLLSFLMIFVPAHRSLSIDAWRRPPLRAATAPAWALWVLRAQIGLVYFYAGLAKLNGDWLRGQPLHAWLAARTDVAALLGEQWIAWLFSYGSLTLDLLMAPALLWRRTRVAAVGCAIAFHLLNWQLFGLGVFPWLMIATTPLFLPPQWMRLRPRAATSERSEVPSRLTVGLAGLYLAIQALVPLRHYLYPGDVSWTEEGHRFAWHMMLREKHADVMLRTFDPSTGRSAEAEPWRYLTPLQARKMSTRPDMIQQLAHHVAATAKSPGLKVYAIATATLNDHPRQWLIDPRIDLAAEPRTLRPARWIVPLGATISGVPLPEARRPSKVRP